ncbi:MAG: glutathione peroxidase [Pseudomonadota bacterium]
MALAKALGVVSGLASLATSSISTSGQIIRGSARQVGTAFDFSFAQRDGGPLQLADCAGGALLIVNTASKCGFTRQYEGLQELHRRYCPRGLTVIAVPSNDFAGQEPGGDEEIAQFCTGTYGVSFPVVRKVGVIAPNAHPFYAWAEQASAPRARPNWNFHKYLIGHDGRLIAGFSSLVKPLDETLVREIEAALTASDKAAPKTVESGSGDEWDKHDAKAPLATGEVA